jgi:hypothetical protein
MAKAIEGAGSIVIPILNDLGIPNPEILVWSENKIHKILIPFPRVQYPHVTLHWSWISQICLIYLSRIWKRTSKPKQLTAMIDG